MKFDDKAKTAKIPILVTVSLEVVADEEEKGADWTQKLGCKDAELR